MWMDLQKAQKNPHKRVLKDGVGLSVSTELL